MALEQHIDQCDNCRDEAQALRSVWTILDSAEPVEPPAGFRAMVWRRIEEAEAARSQETRKPRIALDWSMLFKPRALAVGIVALLLLLFVPVAVPGARSMASMVFPWSLFLSNGAVASDIAVGKAHTREIAGQRHVIVPLSTESGQGMNVTARVVSGTASLEDNTVAISSTRGNDLDLILAPGAWTAPISLELRWTESGQYHTKTISVPAP